MLHLILKGCSTCEANKNTWRQFLKSDIEIEIVGFDVKTINPNDSPPCWVVTRIGSDNGPSPNARVREHADGVCFVGHQVADRRQLAVFYGVECSTRTLEVPGCWPSYSTPCNPVMQKLGICIVFIISIKKWQCRIHIPFSYSLRLLGSLRGSLGIHSLIIKLCFKKTIEIYMAFI